MTAFRLFEDYFLLFLFYSFVGWIGESIYCSSGEFRRARKTDPGARFRFINRGFLSGPLVPLYGFGGLILTLCLWPLREHLVLVFLVGVFLLDSLEFLTSYLMEKLFHARWWDYTGRFGNIQGRIDALHSLYWGLGAVLDVLFIYPPVRRLMAQLDRLPPLAKPALFGFLFGLFVFDLVRTVITTIDLVKFRSRLEKLQNALQGLSPEDLLETGSERLRATSLVQDAEEVLKAGRIRARWVRRRTRHILSSYPFIRDTLAGSVRDVLSHPAPAAIRQTFDFLSMEISAFARDDKYEML